MMTTFAPLSMGQESFQIWREYRHLLCLRY